MHPMRHIWYAACNTDTVEPTSHLRPSYCLFPRIRASFLDALPVLVYYFTTMKTMAGRWGEQVEVKVAAGAKAEA